MSAFSTYLIFFISRQKIAYLWILPQKFVPYKANEHVVMNLFWLTHLAIKLIFCVIIFQY